MDSKVILTDCDGVLLDWEYAFDIWMADKGYTPVENHKFYYKIDKRYNIDPEEKEQLVRTFNESAVIGFLPPQRDAMHYVRKLHQEHGYVFHVITSLSKNRYAQELRIKNLKKVFGDSVFDRFVFLDTGADKHDALKEYQGTGCLWVEDSIKNVEVGIEYGLRGYLMEHGHNMHSDSAPRVKNWKELYEIVT